MSHLSRLRLFHLFHLSKPASDRPIYRHVWQQKPRTIVEVGIGDAQRALWMIQLAAEHHPAGQIHYTGIDLFEDRAAEDGPGLTLKEAHRLLKGSGARVQLVPGTPYEAFSRIANSLGQVDLLLLSPKPDAERLARAWFYIPRILHAQSQVYLEIAEGGRPSVRELDLPEIELLAGALRRRAA